MPEQVRSAYNSNAFDALGLSGALAGFDGHGIAIGFLDFGFDLLHPALRNEMGQTRFHCIWDQNTGQLHSRAAINAWIAGERQGGGRDAAYSAYDPHALYFTRSGQVGGGAHGTAMASIAGGSSLRAFTGVAPAATLIGVQLALQDHHWKEEDADGVPTWTNWDRRREPDWKGWRSYDAAPQIIAGLDFLYRAACQANVDALVVNLSIGAFAGAHDGRSPVEQAIDDLVARGEVGRGPRVAVVAAAGNAGSEDAHLGLSLAAGTSGSFEWIMNSDDPTQNKMEIWYRCSDPIELTISHPLWGPMACPTGRATDEIHLGEHRIGIADHRRDVRGGLSRIRCLVHPPYLPVDQRGGADEQRFTIDVRASARASVHAWIERDDGALESSRLHPADPLSTLTPLACARRAIAVAGYDLLDAHFLKVFPRSSLGPKPWQDCQGDAPLVSAPAVGIWGAQSKTQGFGRSTGTSAAAALVSGTVARLYQRAARSGRKLMHDDLVETLVGILSRGTAREGTWSPRYGWTPPPICSHDHRMEKQR